MTREAELEEGPEPVDVERVAGLIELAAAGGAGLIRRSAAA
jgi:hypothetical protein